MKKRYIGVFDSGLGGLTTVREIVSELPDENIVFLGDTLNMPYGSKTKEEIIGFTKHNIEMLRRFDLKALVIACNTSDANAHMEVSQAYDLPIFGVIGSAVKEALRVTENNRIGVLATDLTVRSGAYEKQIKELNSDAQVFQVACPLLVPLIEKGELLDDRDHLEEVLRSYLKDLDGKNIDTLILGCTHYDLLMEMTSGIMPGVKIVSSSRCVVNDLKDQLQAEKNCEAPATRKFYVSSKPERFRRMASQIIKDIEIEKIIG